MKSCLVFEGHGNFRQKIALSLISLKKISIKCIRHRSARPGLDEAEFALLRFVDEITNGSVSKINDTGTIVEFSPGTLIGGVLSFECPNVRGIGYFVEFLLLVAPFCKEKMEIIFHGVTNSPYDPSIDLIIQSWLPVYRLLIGPSASSALKIEITRRGVHPKGGGEVSVSAKSCTQTIPINKCLSGKVYRIRGMAWSCRVNSSYGQRLICGAKSLLNKFLSDVYVTLDHRKGDSSGKSPGFGITLWAESKDGAVYSGESISESEGSHNLMDPETIGKLAACKLLDQIHQGGFVDSGAQSLAFVLMACEGGRNANRLAVGNPTEYTIGTLRLLKEFLGVTFHFEYHSDESGEDIKHGNENDESGKNNVRHEYDYLIATCFGAGVENINRSIR